MFSSAWAWREQEKQFQVAFLSGEYLQAQKCCLNHLLVNVNVSYYQNGALISCLASTSTDFWESMANTAKIHLATKAAANISLLGVGRKSAIFLKAFPFKLFLVEAGFEICLWLAKGYLWFISTFSWLWGKKMSKVENKKEETKYSVVFRWHKHPRRVELFKFKSTFIFSSQK